MTRYLFEAVVIIYNPNSTGDSRSDAADLADRLKEKLPEYVTVKLTPTEHAGHAEQIAAAYAASDERTLIVSASGDGGYNEVVNGVMSRAGQDVTVAVLPSGNANDHYHATAKDDFIDRIVRGKSRQIDVLEVNALRQGRSWRKYAHSYVGVGLTAYIGQKLTAADLNPLSEKWLVIKYLLRFDSVRLKLDDNKNWQQYSSVIVSNIDRMSKVISLSADAKVNDGQMELYATPGRSIKQILRTLMAGLIVGLSPRKRLQVVSFTTYRNEEIQCDGEVYRVDGGQAVTVRCRHLALKTLA